ncbi:MAG: ribonucleoside-diphosphate reductase beta chain [Thermoleophilaceae bacterium]|jgi:ribonucleotide reductase beta subunit family protein with ferritin-like domain|nr:ribonucleoside-diphosphate reductase beta chain [Thermoleophilaceae bacterium]
MRTATDRISYEDLYARWEGGNWRATEIDFSEDARQWQEVFTEFEREAALWNYALFFWGEDAVADGLSPYIDAAPLEEQKYFLATQQVDEARHAVFFSRFMSEVAGVPGNDHGARLAAIEPRLTWGFRKVFDRLETMCAELRRRPTRTNLAAAVALYHLVIEATLAQPGQHFIAGYLEKHDRLPGFRAGMENVALDEQRHIGFGVKLLSDLCRDDPECKHAVADMLREVIPFTAAVLVPPGWDRRYTEVFGFTLEEIGAEGAASLETKLRSAGIPMEELPGPPIFSPDLEPIDRARLGQRLVYGGILGEKTGPPRRDPDTLEAIFQMLLGGLDAGQAPSEPGTIQWDFADADPWHLVVANGDTRVQAGRVEAPTVTIECRYEDWADLLGGREHPLKLAATRRLRPKGDLRWLWRARRMFPS